MTGFRISACPLFEAQFVDIGVSRFYSSVDYPLEQIIYSFFVLCFYLFLEIAVIIFLEQNYLEFVCGVTRFFIKYCFV